MATNRRSAGEAQHVASETSPLLSGGSVQEDQLSDSTLLDPDEQGNQVASRPKISVRRGVFIALAIWGLLFLQAANMSGLTTTQSKVAEDLDAFDSTTWFTSAYLIAMSSTSPLTAKFAAIFSPRKCLFYSSVLFAVGGVVTSLAKNLTIFLLGRVITGLAGSGIISVSFILVLELTSQEKRGINIGLLNTGFTTGVSFGAVIFGALLDPMGWRFLFWAQAPVALIFGIGILLSIPKGTSAGPKSVGSKKSKLAKLDYLGAITLASAISLFLFGLSATRILWLPIIISLLILLTFLYIELHVAKEPIIPVTVLKSRGALLSCISQLGLMAARWSVLFYTPTYAIAIRAWSPASAGTILIPTNLGFATGGILVGWLHIKRAGSFYTASIVTYCCFAATLFVLSQSLTPTFPVPWFMLIVFTNGFCTGAALNYTLAHMLHLTPPATHYVCTALLTTFRSFAGSFGSAIGGGLFTRTLKHSLERGFGKTGGLAGREELVRKLLGSAITVQQLTGTERMVAVKGYVKALSTLFFAGIGLALFMAVIQAGTGWREGLESRKLDTSQSGLRDVIEDEEWEEGMERGV